MTFFNNNNAFDGTHSSKTSMEQQAIVDKAIKGLLDLAERAGQQMPKAMTADNMKLYMFLATVARSINNTAEKAQTTCAREALATDTETQQPTPMLVK